jgi:hypothetical protein
LANQTEKKISHCGVGGGTGDGKRQGLRRLNRRLRKLTELSRHPGPGERQRQLLIVDSVDDGVRPRSGRLGDKDPLRSRKKLTLNDL